MIELTPPVALALALLAPAGVIGWAALFSVLGIERGPVWSQRHLRAVLRFLGVLFLLSLVAFFVVRPIWVPLAVAYPLAMGALLAWGRVRQLAFVERSGGFSEIGPRLSTPVGGKIDPGLDRGIGAGDGRRDGAGGFGLLAGMDHGGPCVRDRLRPLAIASAASPLRKAGQPVYH